MGMCDEATGAGSSDMSANEFNVAAINAVNPIPKITNELRNCAFSGTLITWFYRLMMALESEAMRALFISGLPKLPCASRCGLPLPLGRAYNHLDINDLAAQPESGFWHLTCSVDEWYKLGIRSSALRQRIAACVRDATKNHATRAFWRAGVEPQNAPPKWRI
jgi:hypothetical protein